ncbi:MAG: tetratricopeptide repeat protein [Fimbriimonadaceae bacterium]|nr:tetratricopeptide repeat protein [Fimbriimonadaceae bacterium]
MAARVTDLRAETATPAWRLENPLLRADFDEDGRMVGLFDKRTNRETLGGLLRFTGPSPRGKVRFAPNEPSEEHEPASLLVGGLLPDGFSFLIRYEVVPGLARVAVEARLFSRLATRPGWGRLGIEADLGGPGGLLRTHEGRGICAHVPKGQTGLALFGRACDLSPAGFDDGWLSVPRPSKVFYPRETETWRFALAPVSGLPSVEAFDEDVTLSIGETLIVQAHRTLPDHRLDLLAEDGRTYTLPAYLYAERALQVDLNGLSEPRKLALVGPDGRLKLAWERDAPPASPRAEPSPEGTLGDAERRFFAAAAGFEALERVDDEIDRAEACFPLRAASHTLAAVQAMRDGDFAEAEARFECALLHNAEDPLAWWGQAVAHRLQGRDEESPALLNAHFLAPFEPALRAESFLAQPVAEGSEPSPLLRDLAEDPPAAVEAACVYIEHGLFDQAARLLEELLRFDDNRRLRRLLAACYLVGTRMEAHAAEQVARIGPLDVWVRHHPVEEWAIRVLTARFG